MGSASSSLPLWLAFLSLMEQANRDALTGLYNRRYFADALADHIEIAERYGRALSLVLLDIDDFKQINDTAGHEAGDAALQHFADCLMNHARKADIVCRFGGDEFAVILPETNKEQAQVFVKRVVEGIAHYAADTPAPAAVFSATAGVAALPSENLVADADADLLVRKRR